MGKGKEGGGEVVGAGEGEGGAHAGDGGGAVSCRKRRCQR